MIIPETGLLLLIFAAVAGGVYALATLCDPYGIRVRSRISRLEAPSGHVIEAFEDADPTRLNGIAHLLHRIQRLNPKHTEARTKLHQRLAKAGIYTRAAATQYYAAKMTLSVLPMGVASGATSLGILSSALMIPVGGILAVLGFFLPSFWLDRAIARHHLLLQKSLPDFLDLMTVCMAGGMSLQETIWRVGDELRLAHPALATELAMVQRDVELGATVDQALKRFATRTDYEGVRTLSTFIREAQRFGTNIAEALRSHADMLRTQREQMAEEKAQKASVKILLPTLFLIFPAIFVVLVLPAIIQIQAAFGTE